MALKSKTLGVIVWPPAIQSEGIHAVLDNLQAAGVTAVSTSPYVAEPCEPAEADRREPPDDGGKGLTRIIDRPLWGKQSLHLRTAPSFAHDEPLFAGIKYVPKPANGLTAKHGAVIADFIAEARRRGLKTYLQAHVSHLPGLRPGVDESARMADVPRLPDGSPPGEHMVHFAALASPDIRAYFAAEVKDILAAYRDVDGLLLDRAEQSVYTLHDAFVDFGPHAQNMAADLDFDFPAMRRAAGAVLEGIANWSAADIAEHVGEGTLTRLLGKYMTAQRGITDLLLFRSAVTTSFLADLRAAADGTRAGVELLPITFPPPLSALTGANFASYSQHADATLIKFFTMHWPLIVTYWSEAIVAANPSLNPNHVALAVSTAFDFEDELSAGLGDYVYPGPDTPHRAGSEAQRRKIRQAQKEAGAMPVLPSVHAYGPLHDVERRWRIGWDAGAHGMWVNRYGYLGEPKLALLRRVVSG
jgi:hypothetical protein